MLHHSARRAAAALCFLFASQAVGARAEGSLPAAGNVAPPSELPPTTSTHEAPPPAPSPLVGQNATLVRQAGIGSQVSYARAGVMELGGSIGMQNSTQSTELAFSPSFGWFVADNFELSAIVRGNYHIDDAGDVLTLNALIEPSFHLPIVDTAFFLAGLGLGVAYLDEAKVAGFALAPRVGFQFLVGRSGLITPSAGLTWSTSDVVPAKPDGQPSGTKLLAVAYQWSANIGYSVMW